MDRRMTPEKITTTLIQEVAKRPCLYAKDTPDYGHLEVREMAWRDVGATVGMSKDQAHKKFRNMRDVYIRELKKEIKAKDGSGRPVRWRFFEMMGFLKPYIQIRIRSEGMTDEILKLEAEDDSNYEPWSSQPDTSQMEDSIVPPDSPIVQRSYKRPREYSEDENTLAIRQSFLDPIQPQPIHLRTEDEDDIYAKYVASELRSITDPRQKRALKSKINNLIYETQNELDYD